MVNLGCDCGKRLIEAAQGLRENDFVLTNIKVLNVFTKEWICAHVYVYKKWISHVAYDLDAPLLKAKKKIDGQGFCLSPAFVDAHTHIESSLLTPANYAKLVICHGTLTVLEDAHEIANVCGEEGLEYMLDAAKDLPMRQLLTVPSCVPSVPNYENSGAVFDAKIYQKFLNQDQVIGLGEVMDYKGVIDGEQRIWDILDVAKKQNCYIQGHAPLLRGPQLSAYLSTGIQSDHEARKVDEIIEKYRQGMWIDIRDANTNHNMPNMIQAFQKIGNYDRVSFSSDDRRSDVTKRLGHLDGIIRHAVACGMPLIEAYISASYRPCLEAGIKHLGAIAPGYVADFNILSDVDTVAIEAVYFEGKCVARKGKLLEEIQTPHTRDVLTQTVNVPDFTLEQFAIQSNNPQENLHVVAYESYGSSITYLEEGLFPVVHGRVDLSSQKDTMFAAVINRHHKPSYSLALVKNFGIDHGAIASTVGHDSHNVTIVYDTPENAMQALQQLQKQKGGFCAVEDGQVIASLALPIAGLMSDKDIDEVIEEIKQMNQALVQLGNTFIDNPISRITILSLLVCPYVKISDMGIVMTEEKQFVPLKVS